MFFAFEYRQIIRHKENMQSKVHAYRAWTIHVCFCDGHLAVTRMQISIEWFRLLFYFEMKKKLFLIAFLLISISINAYDFTVKNEDGLSIYFNYINNGTEVEVTYEGYYKSWNSSKLKYDYYYDGYRGGCYGKNLVIPETVSYNDRTFPVTQIGTSAFRDSYAKSIILPNSITIIGSYSFQDCWIEEMAIPDDVTVIAFSAFSGCNRLKSVSFPEGLKEIRSSAFEGCSLLTTISIPESVTILEGFTKCNGLKTVTIPKNVTDVYFYGCENLLKIYSYIENPSEIYSHAFSDNSHYSGTLYVPKGTVEKYRSTAGWKAFTYIEEISSSEDKKCSTPTLSYSNKELKYDCETNGATIHETIKCSDVATTTFFSSHKLDATYEISAYATADGYMQSETINAKLFWIEGSLDHSGISNIKADLRGILIQNDNDFLTVSGLNHDEKVIMYDIGGKQLSTARSNNGTATFSINKDNKVVIVKIGNESIRVKL